MATCEPMKAALSHRGARRLAFWAPGLWGKELLADSQGHWTGPAGPGESPTAPSLVLGTEPSVLGRTQRTRWPWPSAPLERRRQASPVWARLHLQTAWLDWHIPCLPQNHLKPPGEWTAVDTTVTQGSSASKLRDSLVKSVKEAW